jgi:quinol monooxygenase YgiN
MVLVSLKISIPPKKQGIATQCVRSILGWTCAQPGCISMAFYQDTNDPDTMMLLEEWQDWGSLENHIRSEPFKGILALMEISSQQPEIKLSMISETAGLEAIEAIRSSQQTYTLGAFEKV